MTVRRVLLVEDEKLLADMAHAALENAGYEVVSASQVSDAMQLVREHSFEVAVLDVRLGEELVFGVAAMLSELRIPFLFAAGPSVDSVPSQFAQHPMLQKPYRLRLLTQMVERLLEGGDGPLGAENGSASAVN